MKKFETPEVEIINLDEEVLTSYRDLTLSSCEY
jgi:hypothetical protein